MKTSTNPTPAAPSADAMLTAERIEQLRHSADSGYAINDDDWNALCDMALQSLRTRPDAAGFSSEEFYALARDYRNSGSMNTAERFNKLLAYVHKHLALPAQATQQAGGGDAVAKYQVGRLVTLNQDTYPGLGEWFVQLRDGDEVVARVYGKDHEQIRQRIATLNAPTSPADTDRAAERRGMERAADMIAAVRKDWYDAGDFQKADACEYLERYITDAAAKLPDARAEPIPRMPERDNMDDIPPFDAAPEKGASDA